MGMKVGKRDTGIIAIGYFGEVGTLVCLIDSDLLIFLTS